MPKNLTKKQKIILAVVGLLVVGLIVFFSTRNHQTDQAAIDQTPTTAKKQSLELEQTPIVALTAQNNSQELILSVITKDNFDFDKVEYELIYYLEDDLSRGMSGEIEMNNNRGEKEILLGTCSSGTCRYDEGVTGGEVIISLTKANQLYSLSADFAFFNKNQPFVDEKLGLTITTKGSDLLVLVGGGLETMPENEIIAGPYTITQESDKGTISFEVNNGRLLVDEDGSWIEVTDYQDLPLGTYLLVANS
jgi:hypothetical protein